MNDECLDENVRHRNIIAGTYRLSHILVFIVENVKYF